MKLGSKWVALVAICSSVAVAGTTKTTKTGDTAEKYKIIHVADLSALIEKNTPGLTIVDANNADTRKDEGIIPNARLLTSSKKFDTAKELPADKTSKLVFYCANTRCQASHAAAARAAAAGYTDVNVMTEGIQGWKKAGNTTTSI